MLQTARTDTVAPTPDADVNAVLGVLLSGVRAVLGDQFVGLYLYGSLAMGDFVPHRSDIDFLVATEEDVSPAAFAELRGMHERLGASHPRWGTELEGAYIPRASLRRYDRRRARHPHVDRGGTRLVLEDHWSDWVIQRYVLREHGVVVVGPPLRTLLDPIAPRDVQQAVIETVRDWWAPMRHNQARLHDAGYQPYAVLTMCRVLYTLEFGTVASKTVAARWAQEPLGDGWRDLVADALAWHQGDPSGDVRRTVDVIAYTTDRCRQFDPTGWC